MSPSKKAMGKSADMCMMHLWGCNIIVLKLTKDKLDLKGQKAKFVGIDENFMPVAQLSVSNILLAS